MYSFLLGKYLEVEMLDLVKFFPVFPKMFYTASEDKVSNMSLFCIILFCFVAIQGNKDNIPFWSNSWASLSTVPLKD